MDARNKKFFMSLLKRLTDFLVYGFCFFFVASVVIGVVFNRPHTGQGNIAAAKAQIKQFDVALEVYSKTFGAFPSEFDLLFNPPNGKPIMNAKEVPLDPWGNAYQYSRVGTDGYVVMSLGAEGEVGGDDEGADIRSDEIENEKSSGTLKQLNQGLPTDSHRFAQIVRTQRCV